MSNYIKHLQELSTLSTFNRKKDYINYNLEPYFKIVGLKNLKVLEVGPGMGEFEKYLNEKGIFNIDIVDNDIGVVKYISKNYKIKNSFLTKKMTSIDKKLGQYNFILLMQVLEHIPTNEYASTIKVLFSHLERGGYMAIIVPNGNNPLGITERYADLQHTGCFTEQSLKDLLNLSEIEGYSFWIKGYEIPAYSLVNIIRKVFQKTLHTILLLLMIINGGTFFKTMTPNIMLLINKK